MAEISASERGVKRAQHFHAKKRNDPADFNSPSVVCALALADEERITMFLLRKTTLFLNKNVKSDLNQNSKNTPDW